MKPHPYRPAGPGCSANVNLVTRNLNLDKALRWVPVPMPLLLMDGPRIAMLTDRTSV